MQLVIATFLKSVIKIVQNNYLESVIVMIIMHNEKNKFICTYVLSLMLIKSNVYIKFCILWILMRCFS